VTGFEFYIWGSELSKTNGEDVTFRELGLKRQLGRGYYVDSAKKSLAKKSWHYWEYRNPVSDCIAFAATQEREREREDLREVEMS
jgi:hypothetical protein